ncbi:hypothetical protein QTH97_30015 [Variovorax sp. J22R24]|uniref:hypothetical protein n=1 Tax=Variovorax gracilis TaxID=3053502 RepID=UPI0025755EC4|nr:hypothetical protein [Variovorax sp. J22R24]MDM0109208.1 hypothetical protein [Variovorax sp. J22R24]
MQLLERLNCAQLPMDIDEDDDIEKCRVLRAARLIEADIPPVLHLRGRTSYAGHATVMCVTASGKAAAGTRSRALAGLAGLAGLADNFPRTVKSVEPSRKPAPGD